MSSANCFKLDQSKILSSGNGLKEFRLLETLSSGNGLKEFRLLKTLREKEKMLVTSNFSFSHNVFLTLSKGEIVISAT